VSCQRRLNCLVCLEWKGKKLLKSAKNQTLVTIWGRFVLGAFVFAWLNVAAQPCLMAMQMPAEPEMAAHTDHGTHHVDQHSGHAANAAEDCGHCPPSGSAAHQNECATMQAADCTELPQSNFDARSLKLELKDAPGMFAVAQAPPQAVIPRLARLVTPHNCARLKFTDSPPLNLRYCVFLK
jgi:hypothetical protein